MGKAGIGISAYLCKKRFFHEQRAEEGDRYRSNNRSSPMGRVIVIVSIAYVLLSKNAWVELVGIPFKKRRPWTICCTISYLNGNQACITDRERWQENSKLSFLKSEDQIIFLAFKDVHVQAHLKSISLSACDTSSPIANANDSMAGYGTHQTPPAPFHLYRIRTPYSPQYHKYQRRPSPQYRDA